VLLQSSIYFGRRGEAAGRVRRAARGDWVRAALFVAPVACAAAAILLVRSFLGFQFPVPWPDETGFVAPAFDFARTGSFFDPGMNPDRVVMWMPPGYMVLLAAAFRIFGYGYSLSRWISSLFCLASLGLAARLAWQLAVGWRRVLAGWAVGMAFLTPYMLIDSNIARMEMPFCCLMLLALVALVADRPYAAGALVALGGIVHFNAVYFAPIILLAIVIRLRAGRLDWPRIMEFSVMAVAALAFGLYAMHVLNNWPGFLADMQFQFHFKHSHAQHDLAHPLWIVLAGGALAGIVVLQHRACDAATLTACFGVAFLAMSHGGHEIWYDYGQPLGFALIAVSATANRNTAPNLDWAAGVSTVSAALALSIGWSITPAMAALRPHSAMLHRGVVAPAEIAKVRTFITTLQPGEAVDFGWTGMELFFLDDLARAGAHWTIIRHSVTQVWPFRSASWRVVCDSSEWPALLLTFDIDHPRHGIDSGCDIIRIDGTMPKR
jgi:hypothetical protein